MTLTGQIGSARIAQGAHEWRAASYVRLSVDDGESGLSGSIVSQQKIIDDWAASRSDVSVVARFVDDGWSGSNFERPGFTNMMDAVDEGEVDCILVKDLSRLGRNYLETGRLIERVFPAKGVRLVAVNDGYDGLDDWGAARFGHDAGIDSALLVPFKNLINDFYCATTSSKTKAALAARRREGLYVGAHAPYGYTKSADDHNVLVVDAEAAAVVVRIFELRAAGEPLAAIARRLDDEGVPSPSSYAARAGRGARDVAGVVADVGCSDDCGADRGADGVRGAGGWSASYISRLLKNRTYAGVLVQGRTFQPSFRLRMRLTLPPEQWTYAVGACPAIVDEELFDLVQRLGASALGVKGKGGDNPLRGLAFCGLCGARMALRRASSSGRRYAYYRCVAGCGLSVRAERVISAVEKELGSADRAFLLRREVRVDVGAGCDVSVAVGGLRQEVAS